MMSKRKDDAAKAARDKPSRISQAPPPPTPLPRGSFVPPENTEPARPPAEILSQAEYSFQVAQRHCNDAIRKGWNVKSIDQTRWTYEKKRWSEVLRPGLKDAFAKYKRLGLNVDTFGGLRTRVKDIDTEWRLVCEYRDSIPAPARSANLTTAGQESAAAKALGKHLKRNQQMTRADAAEWCKKAGWNFGPRAFDRVWPAAREAAGLLRTALPGRKPKSSR